LFEVRDGCVCAVIKALLRARNQVVELTKAQAKELDEARVARVGARAVIVASRACRR
jgi:hypothetical protein